MSDETTYAVVVGQTLAQLRASRGLTQATLATTLGVRQSVISRVETGVLPLTVDLLSRWSAALQKLSHEVLYLAMKAVTKLQIHGVFVVNRRFRCGDVGAAVVSALLAISPAPRKPPRPRKARP